jgi:CNT family concentrative nucleoside transporter/purine nucleoside transport protein
MLFAANLLGVFVFLAVCFVLSKNRKAINWVSILKCIILNFLIAWFMLKFPYGKAMVKGAAEGFAWLVDLSFSGIGFAFGSIVEQHKFDFFIIALMPILLIVPLFDILTYIGVLPFIIKWLGRFLGFLTGQPKFESFYAIEMMVLGNTEALAVSRFQVSKMSALRNVTIAMMSMSCITASIVGAYIKMMPGEYILTAVPLNIINALIITNILNPVKVSKEEDVVYTLAQADKAADREPFFSFLGDSILGAGRLILIIVANVIAFVALANALDSLLCLITPYLSLKNIFGVAMFPFAWLLGFDVAGAFKLAQFMGLKLVTNEFVVMGQVTGVISAYPAHFTAVLTVFLTSFANFSTVGMIIGCLKGILGKEQNDVISKNVGYMFISGIFVSLMSAAVAGLFVW